MDTQPSLRRAGSVGPLSRLVALALATLALAAPSLAAPSDRQHWEGRYSQPGYVYGLRPNPALERWDELLKTRATGGRAADVACGECQNAVHLAKMGYTVDCIDISPRALAKGETLARANRVAARIRPIEADLDTWNLPPDSYDCILNVDFCLRRLAPQMVAALKPDGILVFHSFTVDDVKAKDPNATPSHFLGRNELLELFRGLHVVSYQEHRDGTRAVATLVARKPGPGDPLEGAAPGCAHGPVGCPPGCEVKTGAR